MTPKDNELVHLLRKILNRLRIIRYRLKSRDSLKGSGAGFEGFFGYFSSWRTKFYVNSRTYGGNDNYTRDDRIRQLDELCNIKGKRVLELGPLEGGHTLMLSRLGAREIVSIEGRPENFVKCCGIKNLFRLDNVHFILGDIREVGVDTVGRFDCVVALGVLYHLTDPFQVLQRLGRITDQIFIWTHFADSEYPLGDKQTLASSGRNYSGKFYREGGLKDPLSGLGLYSFWPFEDDMYKMIRDAGFTSLKILSKGSLYSHNAKTCTILAKRE